MGGGTPFGHMEEELDAAAVLAAAGAFGGVASCLAFYQIARHLQYYTKPQFQRYILRLIFMVPVYAICSFLSLAFKGKTVYIATARDMYEAFILYNFHALCVAFLGGDGEVLNRLKGDVVVQPSWGSCTCCLPPVPVDGGFLRNCKRATLQFVLLKPVLAACIMLMEGHGVYHEGDFSAAWGYLWVQIVFNISYAAALYGLVIFYLGTHDQLKPFQPLFKFALIKTVVFFTFWQGFVISILSSNDFFANPEDGRALQDLLICVEMLFAALCIFKGFPYQEFKLIKGQVQFNDLGSRIGHAINLHDVFNDTVHQFAPQYHDYVLHDGQSDTPQTEQKGATAKKRQSRIKTYVLMSSDRASLRQNDSLAHKAELPMTPMEAAGAGGRDLEQGFAEAAKRGEGTSGATPGEGGEVRREASGPAAAEVRASFIDLN